MIKKISTLLMKVDTFVLDLCDKETSNFLSSREKSTKLNVFGAVIAIVVTSSSVSGLLKCNCCFSYSAYTFFRSIVSYLPCR